MAWEEESIDGGADFEEVGGKKSPIKLIIIAVVVIAVLAGGYFAYDKFMKKDPEAEEEVAEEVEENEEPAVETGFKVDLTKFTLNLAGSGSTPHYLVTSISLEVSTEVLKTELKDEEDKMLYMTKTRDVVLNILRSKTMKDIREPDASKEIGKEIMFKLNKIYKSGKVLNVYFTELMVQ